jgi:nucleotide-binding universal stress UspA family protein
MKIVVGVDGSEPAQRAVAWCAQYGGPLGAEVVAVHAVDLPVYASPSGSYLPVPPLDEVDRDGLRVVLERKWCAALAASSVRFRAVVVDGPPALVLMEAARTENADLVVTGRRGRGGFAELLLGSTSHQMTHHLDRPLVIVP